MEIRDFALRILTSPELEVKLEPPPQLLTDERPGPAVRVSRPARPPHLEIAPASAVRVPKARGMADPAQRTRILHALANHELQAVELFAWAILAFPEAPRAFRRGLLRILRDEQRHTRAYIRRLRALGSDFGSYPVTGYFWKKSEAIEEPIHFVCAMGLTFENANLDHAPAYAEAARRAGDRKTAAIFEAIERDEIEHVRFAWEWLGRFKRPGETHREAYLRAVRWPLRPALARGTVFHAESRRRAGLDADFIALLEHSCAVREADAAR